MIVEATGLCVLGLSNAQTSTLSKELDHKTNENTGYAQQDKRPKVNVIQVYAMLPKELDTLVIECNVSSCDERE
jgi:hypothetical protein